MRQRRWEIPLSNVDIDTSHLHKESAVLVDSIMTIERALIRAKLGAISNATFSIIRTSLIALLS